MKQGICICAVLVSSLFCAAPQSGNAEKDTLEGAWQLVPSKQSGPRSLPENLRDIKLISSNHFIWVIFDTKTGKPMYEGGGTYVRHGNSYTEHVDFFSPGENAEKLIGKDQQFTLDLNGDTLTLSGTLSTGGKITETWKRVP